MAINPIRQKTYRHPVAVANLRFPIQLQRKKRIPDGQGGYLSTNSDQDWEPYEECDYADIQPMGDAPPWFGETHENKPNSRVYLHYREDIAIGDRIVHGSRFLYIKSITNVEERSMFVELRCTEMPAKNSGTA